MRYLNTLLYHLRHNSINILLILQCQTTQSKVGISLVIHTLQHLKPVLLWFQDLSSLCSLLSHRFTNTHTCTSPVIFPPINYEHTLRSASNAWTQCCCFSLKPSKWSKILPAELQTNDAPPFSFCQNRCYAIIVGKIFFSNRRPHERKWHGTVSFMCCRNPPTFTQNTDLGHMMVEAPYRQQCEALEMQRATERSVVTGDQFLTWWQGRLVCGARYWSVISIADASFCRRPLQQTQGSSISAEWLNWNSCAWEILKRALLFSTVCTMLLYIPNKHTAWYGDIYYFILRSKKNRQMLLISPLYM